MDPADDAATPADPQPATGTLRDAGPSTLTLAGGCSLTLLVALALSGLGGGLLHPGLLDGWLLGALPILALAAFAASVWLLGRLGVRTRHSVCTLSVVAAVLWPWGLLPGTLRFRHAVRDRGWLTGVSAPTAALLLGDCQIEHLRWYDLGPGGEKNYWNDEMYGDLDRAVLMLTLDAGGRVSWSRVLRHREDDRPGPVDLAAWSEASPARRLPMALTLAADGQLHGLDRDELAARLGPPDGRRDHIVYRVDEFMGGSDPYYLMLDTADRLDGTVRY